MEDYFEKIAEQAFNDELEKVADALSRAVKRGLGRKILDQSKKQRSSIERVIKSNGNSKKLTSAYNARKAVEGNIESRALRTVKGDNTPAGKFVTKKFKSIGDKGIRESRSFSRHTGSDELSKKRAGSILEAQKRKRFDQGKLKGTFLEGFK